VIFATEAPKYWAKGLSVIPLRIREKRPVLDRWTQYADALPAEVEREQWLELYDGNNIGLALGPQSGLIAIDVDTEDLAVQSALRELLPWSPWTRIGRKGWVSVYKYDGQRTFQIRNADTGGVVLELLSKGRQVVLPPSIHPDTGVAYEANCPLYEVLDSVPELPREFEAIVRGALSHIGVRVASAGRAQVATFVPAGSRDNAMVAHAGILARAVLRGERTLLEALAEMQEWVKSFTQKVAGDDLPVEKAQKKVVEFLIRDVTGEKKRPLPHGWDVGLTEEDKAQLGLEFGREQVKWSVQEIMDYILERAERFDDPRSQGWLEAVDYALRRTANADIGRIEEDMVLRYIHQNSRDVSSLTTLRKRMSELKGGELIGDNHTEIAAAALGDMEQFGELRFAAGQFWQYKGAHWAPVENAEILSTISRDYGHYPAARRQNDHSGIMRVIQNRVPQGLQQLAVQGLNFANGFLTDDLQLREHSPEYGCTYVLPYRYMPELVGRSPLFFAFLETVWGEDPDYQDKVLALQEAMAASLFGIGAEFQRAICLFGRAGSGKSTTLDLIQALLPKDVISHVPPDAWGDKFMPAQMFGKLLNVAGEISEKKKIPGDSFKLIVDGAEIQAQHKGQQIFSFRPRCTQWFASNVLPRSDDGTEGFNRRWLFLQFNKRIPADQVVRGLADMIVAEEREAIIAWALQAVDRLRANRGYTVPTSHETLVATVANLNNSVRFFLTSCPTIRVGRAAHTGQASTRTSDVTLFDAYQYFCAASGGVRRVPLQIFLEQMVELAPQLDFRPVITTGRQGVPAREFEYLTIVDRKAA
jgi:putative DNA primase/helicase